VSSESDTGWWQSPKGQLERGIGGDAGGREYGPEERLSTGRESGQGRM
jgi:hypothetical protein